jgi:hypothetical protein
MWGYSLLLVVLLGCTSPTEPWPACHETILPVYNDETARTGREVEVGIVHTTYCVVAVGAVP